MKRLRITAAMAQLQEHRRKGVFFVLAVVCLFAALTFVGLSVDLGMITVTQTRMQSTADAAALAAAQEIVVGIREAGENGTTNVQAVQQAAAAAARDMAEQVVQINGFYIDKTVDVELGNRILGEDGNYVENWGAAPYNMVKVSIRKTNNDSSAPDAKLPLIFAPVTGERAHSITSDATAFIESRDIVAVLDYSGSMTFDSYFRSGAVTRRGVGPIKGNLDDIWEALVDSDVRFSDDNSTPKFPSDGFGKIDSAAGTYISSDSTDSIFNALELGGTGGGTTTYFYESWTWTSGYGDGPHWYLIQDGWRWEKYPSGPWSWGVWKIQSNWSGGWSNPSESSAPGYHPPTTSGGGGYVPFPQEGKTNGLLNGKPSESESEDMWKDYIRYVRDDYDIDRGGLRKRYGYQSLMHYLVEERYENKYSEDLWRAPIYPFHGMKEGMSMFANFLNNLGYGDHLGLVTYATTSRVETGINEEGADTIVDLGDEHLTANVMDIDTIQRQKQSGHYDRATAIGYGLEDARQLLDEQGRGAAQKAILLMTDGQSNQYPSGFGSDSLPSGWSWDAVTDFDGDGNADVVFDSNYVSGGNGDGNWRAALHSFLRAKEAVDNGYIVHTISIGGGADTSLMSAIAELGGGEYVHIESGATNEEMEADLEAAFAVLAGLVPPARLVVDED